jgi:phenylacetate-CoA ligase
MSAARDTTSRYVDPAIERLPYEDFRARQLGGLRRLLEEVWASNPFYRERWESAGVKLAQVDSFEAFTELIPPVDKAAFLRDQREFPPYGRRYAEGVDALGQIHSTTGTSGLGHEFHAIGRAEIAAMARGYHYLFRWAGIEPGMRALLTIKLSTLAGGQTYTQGVMSYPLVPLFAADKSTDDKIELMRTHDVQVLQAFSGYLQRIRSALEAKGLNPRDDLPALRAILTGLQAYDPAWMEEIADYWAVPVAEHYGSTQTTLHMATCEHGPTPGGGRGMLHNFGDLVHLEVIDPDTGRHVAPGEEGEIVVTTLFRRLVPVIRFRLGDKARFLPASSCPCGRPFDGVEAGAITRYDDMMKIKGVNFWPGMTDTVVLSIDGIEEFLADVAFAPGGLEVVTLTLEPSGGISAEKREEAAGRVANVFKESVGFSVRVAWTEPGGLPRFDYKVNRWNDRRRLSGSGGEDCGLAPTTTNQGGRG